MGKQTGVRYSWTKQQSLPPKCKLQSLCWPIKHFNGFMNHVHTQMCFQTFELVTTNNFRKMPPEATVTSSEVAVWSATCGNNKHRENPAQPWRSMQGNWWGLCWTKQLAASPLNSLASGKTIKTRVPKENRTVQVQLYCVISEANIIILTVLLRKEEKKS